jgi:hypothetical protein
VRLRIVTVSQTVPVPPFFQQFSQDVLPQTLQNLAIVMPANRLAWTNKFLSKMKVTVKTTQTTSNRRLNKFESRRPAKGLQTPRPTHGRSMCLRCCFPQFQAKFKGNVLFLQISHYKYADRA